MLAIFIARAKDLGKVGSFLPHLVDGGISILQYADDTILFMEHDVEKVVNMKLILCMFEQLSRLKINFHKSDFFFVLVRLETWSISIEKFLDTNLVLYLLDTLVYIFITERFAMQNGIR
jgi:hypothetical protein